MANFYLLPGLQKAHNQVSPEMEEDQLTPEAYFGQKDHAFFKNGKEVIKFLLVEHGLDREDEVWVTTTTDTSFVSSCVTCSVFNYAKPSRVFTPNTKMIWVIHEFGFAHPNIDDLVATAKSNGIPLVEDVAHSFNSWRKKTKLGTYGDYSLHSFPKSFPEAQGGLLVGKRVNRKNPVYKFSVDKEFERIFLFHLPRLNSIREARRRNYKYLSDVFSDMEHIYQLESGIDPFVFGFYSDKYKQIYSALDAPLGIIQMGRTYVKREVLLPVNPFLTQEQMERMAAAVRKILDQ